MLLLVKAVDCFVDNKKNTLFSHLLMLKCNLYCKWPHYLKRLLDTVEGMVLSVDFTIHH